MMRGPWDLRFFLLQQALILVGALGLVFSSCGPLRESPYKSSLLNNRLGNTSRSATCFAYFVPENSTFTPPLTSILTSDQPEVLAAFRSGATATFDASSFPSGFTECVIELDRVTALQRCTAEDLHSEHFKIVTSSIGNQNTVRLEHDSTGLLMSSHCALRSIRGIWANTDSSHSIAATARIATQAAWPTP